MVQRIKHTNFIRNEMQVVDVGVPDGMREDSSSSARRCEAEYAIVEQSFNAERP